MPGYTHLSLTALATLQGLRWEKATSDALPAVYDLLRQRDTSFIAQ